METFEHEYIMEVDNILENANTNIFDIDIYLKLYEQLSLNFSKFSIDSTDLGKIDVEINWELLLKHVKKVLNETITLDQFRALTENMEPEEILKKIKTFDDHCSKTRIECKITITKPRPDKTKEGLIRLMGCYLKMFFYDLFVVTNISTPGCLCFYKARLDNGIDLKTDFRMSPFIFAEAYEVSKINNWPKIVTLELNNVLEWYENLGIGFKQIAKTRIDRSIFALLHICEDDNVSPIILVWLAHALESLYDAPNAMISKVLKERIFLFLEQPRENSKIIKKQIDTFYDTRSRFVHGDFEIDHPSNEKIFEEEDYYWDKIMKPASFAFSIVLGTIQKMALNKWSEIEFSEGYNGKV